MPRILKDVDVQFISLVSKGANKRTILYKADMRDHWPLDGRVKVQREFKVAKLDEEKHLVYGVVYAPDDVDSQGDMMTAAEIEKSAHKFLASLRNTQIDKGHNENPEEGVVVESFIVQKGDDRFPGDEGAWAVAIHVVKEETWEQVKKGEITGLSMGATAMVEAVEKSHQSLVNRIMTAVRKKFSSPVKKDFNDEMLRVTFFPMMDAMYATFWSVMQDDTIADKAGALAESLQQFKDQFTTKKSAADPPDNGSQTEGDTDMTADEVKNILKAQLDEALKPLSTALTAASEKITALEKTVADGDKAVADRVEKIEKSSAGSGRAVGSDTDPEDIVISEGSLELV